MKRVCPAAHRLWMGVGARIVGAGLMVLVGIASTVALQATSSPPAGATYLNCVDGSPYGHCYSFAHNTGTTLAGIWGEWHDNYLTPGTSNSSHPWHISAEQWFKLTNGAEVEEGILNGYQYWGGCSCEAYAQVWADTTSAGVQYLHTIDTLSPDGDNHSYQISRAPTTNDWYIFLTGNADGESTVTESWQGPQEDVGGELYANSIYTPSGSESTTFTMYVEGENTSGNWITWDITNTHDTYADAGFNGTSWSTSEWSWNKPTS
jgi:hypothetical protein